MQSCCRVGDTDGDGAGETVGVGVGMARRATTLVAFVFPLLEACVLLVWVGVGAGEGVASDWDVAAGVAGGVGAVWCTVTVAAGAAWRLGLPSSLSGNRTILTANSAAPATRTTGSQPAPFHKRTFSCLA